jgi:hypothetical protein
MVALPDAGELSLSIYVHGESKSAQMRRWHDVRGTRRKPKACAVCGIEYIEKRTGSVCCSRKCGFEHQRKNHLRWLHYRCDHPPAPKWCDQCGNPHMQPSEFCSHDCSVEASAMDWVEERISDEERRTTHATCSWCSTAFEFYLLPLGRKGSGRTPMQCSDSCARSVLRERRYHDRHVRRLRMLGNEREALPRREIHERDFWFCMLCGERTDPTKAAPHPMSPTLDHIIPVARGGGHTRRNVQTAHFICNSLKQDKTQ